MGGMQECWNRDVTMEREREEEKEICRQIDTETTRHAQINSVSHTRTCAHTNALTGTRKALSSTPPLHLYIGAGG